jgi:hypothetical protein
LKENFREFKRNENNNPRPPGYPTPNETLQKNAEDRQMETTQTIVNEVKR